MTRYMCLLCKTLIADRDHLMTFKESTGGSLNIECPNSNCPNRTGTVIAKLPPYLYRLRKAR